MAQLPTFSHNPITQPLRQFHKRKKMISRVKKQEFSPKWEEKDDENNNTPIDSNPNIDSPQQRIMPAIAAVEALATTVPCIYHDPCWLLLDIDPGTRLWIDLYRYSASDLYTLGTGALCAPV